MTTAADSGGGSVADKYHQMVQLKFYRLNTHTDAQTERARKMMKREHKRETSTNNWLREGVLCVAPTQ